MSIFSRLFQRDSEEAGQAGDPGAPVPADNSTAPATGETTISPDEVGAEVIAAEPEQEAAEAEPAASEPAADAAGGALPETYVPPATDETSPMHIEVAEPTPPPVVVNELDVESVTLGPESEREAPADAQAVALPEPDSAFPESQPVVTSTLFPPPFAGDLSSPPSTGGSGTYAIPPSLASSIFGSDSDSTPAAPSPPRRKATLPPAPASRRGSGVMSRRGVIGHGHARSTPSNGTDFESPVDEVIPPPRQVRPTPPPIPPEAVAAALAPTAAADRASVRATFEDLAVGHVLPVRNLMIELRWGQAPAAWLELARPPLRSLKTMTDQMEMRELGMALTDFLAAIDRASEAGGSTLTGETKEALLAAYAPLVEYLPRAFDLESERDRREPVIVQALLRQVRALEPLMLEKLYAAGLGRLDTLLKASADEIAAVSGLPAPVAAALAAKIAEFKKNAPSALAAPDTSEVRRTLSALMPVLEVQNQAFERAAMGWAAENLAAKQRLRRDRMATYQQIKVTLARLGDLDLVARLEPLPFARKIDELNRYLRHAAANGNTSFHSSSAATSSTESHPLT